VDHRLDTGEQVTEDFLVAGRRGRAVWTVVESEAPERWVIAGEVGGRPRGAVTYTLQSVPRSVNGERIRKLELRGDLRYVPVGELAGRLDAALRSRGAPGRAARSAAIRRRGRSRRP
jgi:hypothetical protein